MARTKRSATYLTNAHPAGRICGICQGPIVNGRSAYVTTDGRHANHANASDCVAP